MPLLLVMYLAPALAVVLFWSARRGLPDAPVWNALRAAGEGRSALVRSAGGALAFVTAVVAAATGPAGAAAFLFGATMVVVSAALATSSIAAVEIENDEAPERDLRRKHARSIAQTLSAIAVGSLGTLAWFFADPAGTAVIAAFATGVSAAGLFLAISAGANDEAVDPHLPMQTHLPAVAAVMMLAATAEPEALLPLGGLLAETETLRSELLLLPLAVTVTSVLVAKVSAPFAARAASLAGPERLAGVLSALALLLLVSVSGLSWLVAGALAIGLVARQVTVAAEQAAARSKFRVPRDAPSVVPPLAAAAAIVCGERVAGMYGATLAALGMTATFASASASVLARAGIPGAAPGPAFDRPDHAEAAATVATTLALILASAPVLVAETSRRGLALPLVATAAPALLAGVLAGAACAATVATRLAAPEDDAGAVVDASRAVAIAAGLPMLVGLVLGAGAAVGVALGFLAWSSVATPKATSMDGIGARLPRSVLLAWGRTIAVSALVGVPVMT